MSRSRLAAIIAALSCLMSLCLVTGASASTIKPIKVAATDQGDGSYAGTATCPAGRRVVSGGYAAPFPQSTVINRAQGNNAWTATAYGSDGFDVVAYCSKYVKNVTTSTATGTMDQVNDQQGGATASCPSGTNVISGGWEYTNPTENSSVYTSRPGGSTDWTVYAASDDTGNSITSYAYCVTGKKLKTRAGEKVGTANTRARLGRRGGLEGAAARGGVSPGLTVASSECKQGETLFGGGYETTPQPDFYNQDGPDTFFGKSARFDGGLGWKTTSINYSNASGEVQAFAVCRVKK